jgi:hypothetical protein
MPYKIAGIDVHKKMLAVAVSDVEVEGEYQFERRMFGSSPDQLRSLAAWLLEQEVEEAVMESTAQYWKPVWEGLERYWKPHAKGGKAQPEGPERYIWRRRNPIAGGGDARGISQTPNAW